MATSTSGATSRSMLGSDVVAAVDAWLERLVFPAVFLYFLVRYVRGTPLPMAEPGAWLEYTLNLLRLLVVPVFLLTARRGVRLRVTWRGIVGVLLALGSPLFFEADLAAADWYLGARSTLGFRLPNALVVFFLSAAYSGFLITAYLNLGRNLSIMPVVREAVTSGLYAHVRHPIYAGALHLAAVTVVVFATPTNVVCLAALNLGAHLRMLEEEALMGETRAYRDYMERVRARVYTPILSSPLVFLALLRVLS